MKALRVNDKGNLTSTEDMDDKMQTTVKTQIREILRGKMRLLNIVIFVSLMSSLQ